MEKILDARGKQCPIPVVMAKKSLAEAKQGDIVRILVDNEIAVQNLEKMAKQKGCGFASSLRGDRGDYEVRMSVDKEVSLKGGEPEYEQCCSPSGAMVVVIGSDQMGRGNEELGLLLMKGFIYALGQQDQLPASILFYNGGAKLTTAGSPSLEDLKELEGQGVEILTCGTCLNYYGLEDKLEVGGVTNMYQIAETMAKADKIVKP